MTTETIRKTPLFDVHQSLHAKFTVFGGWDMPVYYSGIISEHEAVRKRTGIFDVSHMCPISIEGPHALTFLQNLCTNNVERLGNNRVQYNLLCNERGGVIDDILLYKIAKDKFIVVANASNAEKVLQWLQENVLQNITIAEMQSQQGIISLQGPNTPEILKRMGWGENVSMRKNDVATVTFKGKTILFSRTGYTGSDGFEFFPQNDLLQALWIAFTNGPGDAAPCGLGARDSLRIEAGLPLYGHEYSENRVPIGTPFEWAIKWDKGDFVGRKALQDVHERGPEYQLVGWKSESRSIPRAEQSIYPDASLAEPRIGWISSGGFSPILSQSMGFAFIERGRPCAPETPIYVDIRGRATRAIISRLPFMG
jgi:aminomethyltransferase